MRDFLRRWSGPGITFFIGLGFELIPPIESSTLAYMVWMIAAIWAVYTVWPWLKRWRPFTLAPANSDSPQIAVASPALPSPDPEGLKQLRAEIERLKAENSKLVEKLTDFNGDRHKFRELLNDAYTEGMDLRGRKPSEEQARKWGSQLRNLLERAVGDEPVNRVLRDEANFKSAIFGSTSEQMWMESRLNRLHDLIRQVESRWAIPFRSGFDPHDWKNWKSPPQVAPGEHGVGQKRPGYWENRQMLHAALKDFYAKSFDLQNEDYYEDDEVKQWESRTSQLIAESLGQERVNGFLTNDDRLLRVDPNHSPRLAWLQYRRAQLGILIQVVNSLCSLEIRPDFDGRKWVGSEQFRYEQGTAY